MSANFTTTYDSTSVADSNCGSDITCNVGEFCCQVYEGTYQCENNDDNYDDCREIGEGGIRSIEAFFEEYLLEVAIASVCITVGLFIVLYIYYRNRERRSRNATMNINNGYPQAPQPGLPPSYSTQPGVYPPPGMPPPPPMPYPPPMQQPQQNQNQDLLLAGGLMLGKSGFL